ncbi:MAG: ATP-binding cassette domain-containing protein [Xanthobacteraceae bacterium]|nr:ATP-binding cassette domain-containing protein [Xanthobacteraceae bacterium]
MAPAQDQATWSGQIDISGLRRTFTRGARSRTVVDDCSLSIEAGKLTVMIGPSGCGKSTLAKLIAGYDKPDAGKITIDGRAIKGAGRDRLMVFQESALFSWMTNESNAFFGLRQSGQITKQKVIEVESFLDQVGLLRFAKRFPSELSGGMQRRLEMVRALVNKPDLFILDEPFRGLDAMTRALMQENFATMFDSTRCTTLFITTDIDEALLLADHLLIMTNSPMKVADKIVIDLPRPRKLATIFADERANRFKEEALNLLYPEAMRAFEAQAAPAV